MKRYSLTHLSDEVLRSELANKAKNEKEATAELIAHLARGGESTEDNVRLRCRATTSAPPSRRSAPGS